MGHDAPPWVASVTTWASMTRSQRLAHVRKLRRIVIQRDLPRPPEFDQTTDEQLVEVYNGIGSAKFKSLLGITTAVFQVFEASALIHDYCWSKYFNDGSRARFTYSNNCFRAGNLILASTCGVWFAVFRPQQRKIYRAAGESLYRVVDSELMGWPIWRDGATSQEPGPEVLAC